MNIVVTGYFGTGSSAALDLLSEYSCNGTGIKDNRGGYEHTTLYHPGGIFDLEDKLLKNNDLHRSDEAIRTFQKEMLRLNNYNFGWYGSFKNMFGNVFEKNLDTFLQSLHPFKIDARYYGQCEKVIFNPFKIPVQFAAKALVGRTIYKWGRQFVYHPIKQEMKVAFPTEDEFYSAAKKFVSSYMAMYKEDGKEHTLFDRFLLCHNLHRIPRYFDDSLRVIRVQRDIRDVYILNKYLWKEINAGTMYPDDLSAFLDYWKRVNACEIQIQDDRILTINFEDLVYKYDETVEKIEKQCHLASSQHKKTRQYFEPEKSIKNTQVYKLRKEWAAEIAAIEKEFPEFLYNFPYDIETKASEMFDDSRIKRKSGLINILRKN